MTEVRAFDARTDGAVAAPLRELPERPRLPRRAARVTQTALDWLPKGRSLPLSDWHPRHRWLVALLWAHAVALPAFALARGFSAPHVVLEGAAVAGLAAAATFAPVAPRGRAAIAAFGLVTCSAVLVHFSGGAIEAHFHFFVVLILLTLYEDWIPFLIAFGYVVVHHGLAGTLSPQSVYNHADAIAHPWKWALIHGAFVSAAGVGGIVAWRLNETTRARAGEAIARAMETQETNAVKDKFLATTSHELRTPLTSIAGFATTLTRRWSQLGETEKLRGLEVIESQSARLAELIDELLLLSAVGTGEMRIRREEVQVSEALRRVVESFGSTGEILLRAPANLVAFVDERYFAQIVENYIANARKYGSPPVVVTATASPRWLEVSVADQGEGVPEEFVPQLFEPFTRGTEAPGVHGAGLGLSIVRGLVEAQGGDAWYERNRPRGACFKARFPVTADGTAPSP
jgi:signal transduction histidine kinase